MNLKDGDCVVTEMGTGFVVTANAFGAYIFLDGHPHFPWFPEEFKLLKVIN